MLIARDLRKTYPTPSGPLEVLSGAALTLARGEAAAITGPSGSGKSSLLYILGALEPPTAGSVTLDGTNPFALGERDLAAFRNRHVGFVFQEHCLLSQCSVIENVLAPTIVARDVPGAADRARHLIDRVGLTPRIHHRPAALSGGERQRAAIARALVLGPTLLLCDEPTGNLDRRTADLVASLLLELHREEHTILIVVTHSPELARRLPARFELSDGRLVGRLEDRAARQDTGT